MNNEKYKYIITAVSNNVRLMGEKQTIEALKQYIENNNPNGFTRNEETRENILKVNSNEIIKTIEMPVEEFIKQFVRNENNYNNEEVNSVNVIIKALSDTIKKIKVTYQELTPEQLHLHVYNSIDKLATHDYSCITRDNDQRKKVHDILENMSNEKFYNILGNYLKNSKQEVIDLDELKVNIADIVMNAVA